MKFFAVMLLLAGLYDDPLIDGDYTTTSGSYAVVPEREQREDGLRCVLSYTFFEDAENYERIALCTQEQRWCNPDVMAWLRGSMGVGTACTQIWDSNDTFSTRCLSDSVWCKGREIHAERLVVGPTIECAGKGCPVVPPCDPEKP